MTMKIAKVLKLKKKDNTAERNHLVLQEKILLYSFKKKIKI
jgi:hypothetical protein